MKITKRNRKGFTLVELLVVMAIIAVLASIATPIVFDKLKDGDRTKAVSNAKQIYLGVLEFERRHGIRPGESAKDDISGSSASTANDVFKQMIMGKAVKSEVNFYAKSKISKDPDNDIGTSPSYSKACEKGEVGFLYVDNHESQTGAPLCAAPLLSDNTFDADAYNGQAVVLKTDGSVSTLDIDEVSKKVMIKVGGSDVDMFSSANTLFRNAPKLLYPVPR